MSHPNQPAHLACSVFNFPQSVFNFLLPAPCHRCSDALCLYKRHVPQLPAVTWPQKCHLGKNRLFSLTFASLKGSGSQGHTVHSVISSQIMKGHCNYFAFSVKMEGETSIDRKLQWEGRISHLLMHFRWKTLLQMMTQILNLRKSIWIKTISINITLLLNSKNQWSWIMQNLWSLAIFKNEEWSLNEW